MKTIWILVITMLCACGPIEKKNSLKKNQNLLVVKGETNDPVFYHGSSFGDYFQILSRTGRYTDMLNLTSKNDRLKYGDSLILSVYKDLNFAYPLNLKAYKKENEIYWLYYDTEINATRVTFQFPVVLENDSCKFLMSQFHNP